MTLAILIAQRSQRLANSLSQIDELLNRTMLRAPHGWHATRD